MKHNINGWELASYSYVEETSEDGYLHCIGVLTYQHRTGAKETVRRVERIIAPETKEAA